MILRLASCLLLTTVVSIAYSAESTCPELPKGKEKCSVCQDPILKTEEQKPRKLDCNGRGKFWFINGNDYIDAKDPLVCKENGDKWEWSTKKVGGITVASALCVPQKLCSLSGSVNTTAVLRLVQPVVTRDQSGAEYMDCPDDKKVHIIWADDLSNKTKVYNYSLVCDSKQGLKWRTQREEKVKEGGTVNVIPWKPVTEGSKVYCQVPDDDDGEEAAAAALKAEQDRLEDNEDKELWLYPLMVAAGFTFALAVATPLAFLLLRFMPRKRGHLYKPAVEVWSKHWETWEDSPDWNWPIVLDMIKHWHEYPVTERAKFLETGYAELGYQSTISQMLFLFEHMLIQENHHLVWRPMINFLIRLKRLTTPPYSDSELSIQFNAWISYQGRKLLDEFGYHPDDGSDSECTDSDCSHTACSQTSITSDSDYSEDDGIGFESDLPLEKTAGSGSCSCSDDGMEEVKEGEKSKKEGKGSKKSKKEGKGSKKSKKEGNGSKKSKKEGKGSKKSKKEGKGSKKSKKEGKEGAKRGAAGADAVVKAEEVKPAEVTATAGGAPKEGEVKAPAPAVAQIPAVAPAPAATPAQAPDAAAAAAVNAREIEEEEELEIDDEDPHDAYMRYMGVFLMTLGGGGRTMDMFKDLDAVYKQEFLDIEGPVRAAIGANRILRDPDLSEFERIWRHLKKGERDVTEWGSVWEHTMYALGFVLDELPVRQIEDFVMMNKGVTARHIMWWFRGCNEAESHMHLNFLLKNKSNSKLLSKMPMESKEYYECVRMYCLFDHSSLAWNKVEQLVVKNVTLAKRLNVPDYRRRAQHFTAYYADHGERELGAWLADRDRAAEIDDVDFQPMPKLKVISKPAS